MKSNSPVFKIPRREIDTDKKSIDDFLKVGSPGTDGEREIALMEIARSPYQPRLHLDPTHINELAESIRAGKLIEPIIVRPCGQGYELIAGEHRLEAFKLLGRGTIPAIVRNFTDDEAHVATLVDNLKRKSIADYEAGLRFRELKEKKGIDIASMARTAGVSRQYVYRALALANLPEAIRKILDEDPFLIRGNAGDDLRHLVDSDRTDLALQAVHLVKEKKLLQTDIAKWAAARMHGKKAEKVEAEKISCLDSRFKAHISAKDKQFTLSIRCLEQLDSATKARLHARLEAIAREFSLDN